MSISIRKAQAEDIPTIFQFIKKLAVYEKLEHEVTGSEEELEKTLFCDKPFAEVLIAEMDGLSIGFALFFHSYSTFLTQPGIYLEDLFVLPEYRGMGAGKLLLSYLAQLAVERGCGRLEWSVLDWNKPAIDFYDSLSAKPLSDWFTYRLAGEALNDLADQKN